MEIPITSRNRMLENVEDAPIPDVRLRNMKTIWIRFYQSLYNKPMNAIFFQCSDLWYSSKNLYVMVIPIAKSC